MLSTMHSKHILLALGLAVLFASKESSAALVAFEDFNYTNVGDDLNGKSGGGSFGFSDSWTGDTTFNLGNGSLVSPTGQPVATGNRMSSVAVGGNRDIERNLSSPLGAPNTTAYFSFLMQPEGILHQGFDNGWFTFTLRGGFQVLVGMDGNSKYGVEVSGTANTSNVIGAVGQTNLFVLRIDFTEGVDIVRLYINPPPGTEPALASASLFNNDVGSVTKVALSGPGASGFDALRVGTTWADVTPVPEPSSLALAAIGLASLAAWNWRKRSRA